MDLEKELGCVLFERSKQGIILTDDGMLLRRRAGEIAQLVHTTESELQLSHDVIAGTISIGCAETRAMECLGTIMQTIRNAHPDITYNIVSDTAENVAENINKGLLDFGLMLRQTKNEGLDYISLGYEEHTVVLFRNDSPLAEKEVITLEDLIDIPLLVPSTYKHSKILGEYRSKDEGGILTFVATYNLLYNAARLVENGFGVAITLEGLVNVSQSANLAYKPLKDAPVLQAYLAWKPFQFRSNACKAFLEEAKKILA
ncbi:transcriptional regulator [Cryptobacterium sp. CAG:338]|nr:transcriptional regulator [Cryptobacterium sp. CAG:338]